MRFYVAMVDSDTYVRLAMCAHLPHSDGTVKPNGSFREQNRHGAGGFPWTPALNISGRPRLAWVRGKISVYLVRCQLVSFSFAKWPVCLDNSE